MLSTALAKLLSLKVAAAATVAVAATGGVAVAAANGKLPDFGGSDAKPSASASAKPSDAGKSGTKGNASPSPSMVGLCRAFQAKAADNPGKALENPAFTALITTAGDKEKVAAYCDALLASQKPTHTAPTNAPSGRPAQTRTTRPTGKPTSRPTTADTQSGAVASPRPTS